MNTPAISPPADASPGAPMHQARLAAVFGLAYLALAFFAASLPVQTSFPYAIWPGDGLALGVLLVVPQSRWPLLIATAAVATAIVGLAFDIAPPRIVAGALTNAAEPALVAAGLLRLGGGRAVIATLLGLGAFFVNIVPTVAAISLADALITSYQLGKPLRELWTVEFVSEFLGMIVFAPLILAWTHGGWRESRRTLRERTMRDGTPELVALFMGLVLASHIVFGASPRAPWFTPALAYLCAPFLIWAALRFGLRSATLGLAVFSVICYWHTAHGNGPFAADGRATWASMQHLQAYLATVIVTTLFAAALLGEREAAARSTQTWRRRHETAIRASGNLLYELDPVSGEILWDGDTRAVLGVDAADIATTAQWRERVHPDDRPRLRGLDQRLVAGEIPSIAIEYRLKRAQGEWITVGVNGFLVGDPSRPEAGQRRIIGFVSDVSARIRAEAERQALAAQLKQAEKMEAVGNLAGGIAHDFNNILGAILGYGELAQARAQADAQLKRYLDTIVGAGNRAKSLVSQILAYSRAEGGVQTPVIVGPVATEVCNLLRGSTAADVEVRLNAPAEELLVMGDPTRLHQLLMNLASNAIQAMPHGGLLEINVATSKVDLPLRTRLSKVPPGEFVVIEVKDTGEGIAPGVIDRIFEPFFTTKPAGRGTGLGLALVHTIVKEHEGAIDVVSEVGRGTTFTVWLPRLSGADVAPAPERVAEPGRGQVVLAVDDEPEVLAALEEMLATLGYEPVGYTSSRAALEAFRADPRRFEAVISDEVMPSLTGTQLVVELRRLKPDIPFVIATGYGGAGFETRALAAGVNRVLKKPYRMQEIGDVLKGVLDQA